MYVSPDSVSQIAQQRTSTWLLPSRVVSRCRYPCRYIGCFENAASTAQNLKPTPWAILMVAGTLMKHLWNLHGPNMQHAFSICPGPTCTPGPTCIPGPTYIPGPTCIPGPNQPVRAFLELETKPSSWILLFVFPSPLAQLAEVSLVILVTPVVYFVPGPSRCEAFHTSVHPARVSTEGTLGRLLARDVLYGVYLLDKFRVVD